MKKYQVQSKDAGLGTFFLNISMMVSMSTYHLLDRPLWFCDKHLLPNHQADHGTTHF